MADPRGSVHQPRAYVVVRFTDGRERVDEIYDEHPNAGYYHAKALEERPDVEATWQTMERPCGSRQSPRGAFEELGEALNDLGRALLATWPGRRLVGFVEWLNRKLEDEPKS